MEEQRQSVWGKFTDIAFIAGIVLLVWGHRLSAEMGFGLLMAIAQARGAVGAVSKVVDRLRGGGNGDGGGGTGSSPNSTRGGSSEPPKRDDAIKRVAIGVAAGSVRNESAIGWGLSAFVLATLGALSRVRTPVGFAVVVFAVACGFAY